jgi:hypothetical protein
MIALTIAVLLAAAPAKAPPSTSAPTPTPPSTPAAAAPRPSYDNIPLPPPPKLPEGARGGALRVAVLDPRASGDVAPRPLAAFTQSLVPELRKMEGVSAIGMAEIRDMLGFERQRQMLGCSADEGCLAEIAGALGVDDLVTTDLVLVGTGYTLTMKRIDMRRAKVIQSETRRFDRRDGEELLSVVGPAVASLFPGRPLKPGKTRGVDREVIRRLNPPPLPRWAFLGTAGAAAAALAGAGVSQLMVADSRRQYDGVIQKAQQGPVAAADLAAAASRVRSREQTRNALLYAGAGLALAGGVEAFFTDWRNDRAALVTPALLPGGAGGVVVGGRF